MKTTTIYRLTIKCHPDHSEYNRSIPFRWEPSGDEIYDSIRRLRGQAKNNGVTEVVKIASVALAKIGTKQLEINLDFQSLNEHRIL